MLWGGHNGALELRRAVDGGTRLRGRFKYNAPAVLSDGGRTGRPRKEVMAPHAFAYRVNKPDENIHLLVGHDYGQPLASRAAGTLKLKDSAEALSFEAMITPEMEKVTWVQDAMTALAAGLIAGISPGFRIPPKRAVPEAEKVEDEGSDPTNGEHNAIIRTVLHALLFELSLVTVPAYPETQVEMRNWTPGGFIIPEKPDAGLRRTLNRWRA